MRTITKVELDTIIANHKHWLNEDCDDFEKMRADLSYADLSYADLRSADLRSADLCSADLSSADLRFAKLHSAKLRSADLSYADLRSADLCSADLSSADLHFAKLRSAKLHSADLSYADLSYADLRSADLSYADLRSADLRSADLSSADLSSADLSSADLSSADLRSANLRVAKNVPFVPLACPECGSFIGWKKSANNFIVKLEICEDAKRLSATTTKCRCNKAKVLAIETLDGTDSGVTKVKSAYDHTFVYEIGKIVTVSDFDENRWNECAAGIHFFINRQEAVRW